MTIGISKLFFSRFHTNFEMIVTDIIMVHFSLYGLIVTNRPHLISLYLDEPDLTGHYEGPDSDKVSIPLKSVNLAARNILDRLGLQMNY